MTGQERKIAVTETVRMMRVVKRQTSKMGYVRVAATVYEIEVERAAGDFRLIEHIVDDSAIN